MTTIVHNGAGDPSLPRMTLAAFFYNQRSFAEETVRGALAQTYGNTEILLSDDGSPDGTGDELMRLASDYSGPHRVIVNVNERNLGFGRHFASATRLCTGEWVVTQGGDDISTSNRLEKIAEYVGHNPDAMAIGSAGARIDKNGVTIGATHFVPSLYEYPRYQGGSFCISNLPEPPDKVRLTPVLGATAAYRRTVILEPEFPDDVADEDLFLSLRAICRGSVLMIPDTLVRRRVDPNSLSHYRKSDLSRRDRRVRRLGISRMRYLAYRAACRELLSGGPVRNGLQDHLAQERARMLLQCLEEPVNRRTARLYREAFAEALGRTSWLKLAEDALGRGRLRPFLHATLVSLFASGEETVDL